MNASLRESSDSYVERLMHELAEGIDAGRVPASIFGNEWVYREELRRIFGRCWVYLAHTSEVPNPGDFVTRKIGGDDFIATRDENGEIHALLNACKHRGVQVCRADRGNTLQFKCMYHGWTYAPDGRLLGAPLWKHSAGSMSKADNGLVHAAQVDSHQGLIFATLDPSAPSLKEYLGGMAWYIDLVFGLNKHGVEIVGPPQRVVVPGNWKSPSDNAAGDDFHLATLHKSASALGAFPVNVVENMKGYHIQAAPGHSLSMSSAMTEEDPGPRFLGFPQELTATFDTSSITAEQLRAARLSRVIVGNVFPNLTILALPVTEDAKNHRATAAITLRTWQPKGPFKTETFNQFAVYKNATPAQKARSYAAGLGNFSMGGLFEMDDSEPWGTIAKTGGSISAELLNLQLNFSRGLPGIGVADRVHDWPGPGIVYSPRYEEGVQRNLYKFYADLMLSPPGKWPTPRFPG